MNRNHSVPGSPQRRTPVCDRPNLGRSGLLTDWPVVLTPRLSIASAESADLPGLLTVRKSNPERLLRTEGSQGEPGLVTLEMLERDLMIAGMDPARAMLTVRLRDSDTLIGLADVLLEHPEDGHPWIGAIEIAKDFQRRSLGRETLRALLTELVTRSGHDRVRCHVSRDDMIGRSFLEDAGFVPTFDDVWESSGS